MELMKTVFEFLDVILISNIYQNKNALAGYQIGVGSAKRDTMIGLHEFTLDDQL
jgi:hypothetical protein